MNINKNILISIILIMSLLSFQSSLSQCDSIRYRELIKEGDGYLKKANYRLAMNAYSAAMIACKEKMPDVQMKIIILFGKINLLKEQAEKGKKDADKEKQNANIAANKAIEETKNALREKNRADSLLDIANKILSQFYFYDFKFALAFKVISEGKRYGFIDKQGNTVIAFNYIEAYPFDEKTGFAKVKRGSDYCLIDTTGHKEFLLCEDITRINSKVEALNLNYKELKEIPEKVFSCKQLNILLLSHNMIYQIPAQITVLADSLYYLDLSTNNITLLPSEIGDLQNLKILDLNQNRLDSLPSELGNLKKLKSLNLSSLGLRSLPVEIGNLENLTKLCLNWNNLASVPVEIGNLENLKELYLEFNNLTSLPSEIGKLENLTILYLFHNQLTSLPAEIGKLENLTILYLNNNQLTSLPAEIRNLKKLTSLNLDGNNFPEIEKQQIQQWLPNCKINWGKE